MLQLSVPVKFLGTETKSGVSKNSGKPYEIIEAKIFVPDLGRIKVNVRGKVKLPEEGQTIALDLSLEQGSFSSAVVLWDESTKYKVVS